MAGLWRMLEPDPKKLERQELSFFGELDEVISFGQVSAGCFQNMAARMP